jgi:hypothetical protein
MKFYRSFTTLFFLFAQHIIPIKKRGLENITTSACATQLRTNTKRFDASSSPVVPIPHQPPLALRTIFLHNDTEHNIRSSLADTQQTSRPTSPLASHSFISPRNLMPRGRSLRCTIRRSCSIRCERRFEWWEAGIGTWQAYGSRCDRKSH